MGDSIGKTILIIEDNDAIRTMLKTTFTDAGYTVTEADNGATGLQYLQTQDFSATILDLKMPQIDGLELLKQIKNRPDLKNPGPLIVYTSVAYDYVRDEVLREGAAAFLNKDAINPKDIVVEVEKLIHFPIHSTT